MAGYIGKGQSLTLVDGYTRAESDAIDTGTQQFNRIGSDGSIIDLRKDGTTVGSIGTSAGDIFIGSGNTNLFFDEGNAAVWPANSSGNANDASIDLGFSSIRYKNLYLSGGVYVGGTAAANHLDDYEEGTFTPSGPSSVSYFKYTKVGDLVYLEFDFTMPTSSSTSAANVTLPFAGTTSYGGSCAPSYTNNTTYPDIRLYNNTAGIRFRASPNGSTMSYAQVSGSRFIGGLTYKTTA